MSEAQGSLPAPMLSKDSSDSHARDKQEAKVASQNGTGGSAAVGDSVELAAGTQGDSEAHIMAPEKVPGAQADQPPSPTISTPEVGSEPKERFQTVEVDYKGVRGTLALSEDGRYLFWTPNTSKNPVPNLVIRTLRIDDFQTSESWSDRKFLAVYTKNKVYTFQIPDTGVGEPPRTVEFECLNALRAVVAERRLKHATALESQEWPSDDSEFESEEARGKMVKQRRDPVENEITLSLESVAEHLHAKFDWRGPTAQRQIDNLLIHSEAVGWAMEMLVEDDIRRQRDLQKKKPKPPEPAVPEIRHLDWDEWERVTLPLPSQNGQPAVKRAAIEMLDDEPSPRSSFPNRSGRKTNRSTLPNEVHVRQPDGTARRRRRLPDRIRITSRPIIRTLEGVVEHRSMFVNDSQDITLQRPYKVLVLSTQAIHNRMKELEAVYDERSSVGANVGASENLPEMPDPGSRAGSASPKIAKDTEDPLIRLSDDQLKEAVEDFRCLSYFLDNVVLPVRDHLRTETVSVHYDELWHLFSPGMLVYAKDSSVPQKVWKVVQATGGRQYYDVPESETTPTPTYNNVFIPFRIDCYHLDYDGSRYQPVWKCFEIEQFQEELRVRDLQVMPLKVAVREQNGQG